MPYGRNSSTHGVLDRDFGGAMLTCLIATEPSVDRAVARHAFCRIQAPK
jgi:hypothetical protein